MAGAVGRTLAAVRALAGVEISAVVLLGESWPGMTSAVRQVWSALTAVAALVAVAVAWVFRDYLLARLPDRFAQPINRVQFGLFENLRNPWVSIGMSLVIWLATVLALLASAAAVGLLRIFTVNLPQVFNIPCIFPC